MLDQLQEMMENLRSGDNGRPDPASRQMRKSLSDLDKLLKDQQALRDDTFRQDQRERSGAEPSEQNKDDSRLADRQRELQERLDEIERQLRGAGVDTPKNLDDASGAMAQAQKDLKGETGEGKSPRRYGHSPKGDAVEQQGKAIEALRQGGQAMAEQMRGRGKGRQRLCRPPRRPAAGRKRRSARAQPGRNPGRRRGRAFRRSGPRRARPSGAGGASTAPRQSQPTGRGARLSRASYRPTLSRISEKWMPVFGRKSC